MNIMYCFFSEKLCVHGFSLYVDLRFVLSDHSRYLTYDCVSGSFCTASVFALSVVVVFA